MLEGATSFNGFNDIHNVVTFGWMKTGCRSCLPAKADVIVGIEVIHDGVQIGAGRVEAFHLRSEPLKVLDVPPRRPALGGGDVGQGLGGQLRQQLAPRLRSTGRPGPPPRR